MLSWLDWTVLQYGAESLGSDFHRSPVEDEMGLFLWWDGGNRDLKISGFNSTKIKMSMIPHPTMGLQKFLFQKFPDEPTSTGNWWGHGGHPIDNSTMMLKKRIIIMEKKGEPLWLISLPK